jgi:hypothetical protein
LSPGASGPGVVAHQDGPDTKVESEGIILVAKSFFRPPLTLTLSPRWERGDKRKELLANAINNLVILNAAPLPYESRRLKKRDSSLRL